MQSISDVALLSIFEHLPITDRLTARSVCKRWTRLLQLNVLRRNLDFTTSTNFIRGVRKRRHDSKCERYVNEKCFCSWRRQMKLFQFGGETTRILRLPKCIDVAAIGWLMHNRYVNLIKLDITLLNFETEVDFCNFPKGLLDLTVRVETRSDELQRRWVPINVEYLQDVRRLVFESAFLSHRDGCSITKKLIRLESLTMLRCYLRTRLQSCERVKLQFVECVVIS